GVCAGGVGCGGAGGGVPVEAAGHRDPQRADAAELLLRQDVRGGVPPLHHRRPDGRLLHLRRGGVAVPEGGGGAPPDGRRQGRRRHEPAPQLPRVRLLLPRRGAPGRRHHHCQPLLHPARDPPAGGRGRRHADRHRGLRRGQGAGVRGREGPARGHRRRERDGCVEFSELIAGEELPEAEEAGIHPDDVVALPYSSGTTGLPKGVMLTHRSLITSVAQQVDGENPNLYFSKEDVLLCLLPLFHIYSLNSVLLAGLRAGSAMVIMRKFDIGALVELVRAHGITIAPFVPPIVVEIAKSPQVTAGDLASIRMVMSGAAPMGKELQDAFMAKIPNAVLGQGYGMTEAGPVLAMCLAFAKEPFKVKSGSCGTVVRNAALKIVDPDTGASLGRNQPGEICIRGEQIMKGYLNDPESTKNTIDKDGWLHTGDIGLVDDDDEIFIVDRLKEIIKYKGFQVAPAELEALLITHPEIKDAAVVSLKDDLAGEVPVAFVMRIEGSEITEDDIKKFVAKEVVFYKRIHKVFFTDSIPKNPSGKILRKDLRARLAAGIPS
ncbi:hypothetical protein CFC21_087682, partial [Triticum aestivum]